MEKLKKMAEENEKLLKGKGGLGRGQGRKRESWDSVVVRVPRGMDSVIKAMVKEAKKMMKDGDTMLDVAFEMQVYLSAMQRMNFEKERYNRKINRVVAFADADKAIEELRKGRDINDTGSIDKSNKNQNDSVVVPDPSPKQGNEDIFKFGKEVCYWVKEGKKIDHYRQAGIIKAVTKSMVVIYVDGKEVHKSKKEVMIY